MRKPLLGKRTFGKAKDDVGSHRRIGHGPNLTILAMERAGDLILRRNDPKKKNRSEPTQIYRNKTIITVTKTECWTRNGRILFDHEKSIYYT